MNYEWKRSTNFNACRTSSSVAYNINKFEEFMLVELKSEVWIIATARARKNYYQSSDFYKEKNSFSFSFLFFVF